MPTLGNSVVGSRISMAVREGKGDVPPGLTPRHVILSSMGTGVFFTTVKHYSISGGGGDINAEIT